MRRLLIVIAILASMSCASSGSISEMRMLRNSRVSISMRSSATWRWGDTVASVEVAGPPSSCKHNEKSGHKKARKSTIMRKNERAILVQTGLRAAQLKADPLEGMPRHAEVSDRSKNGRG
jgi:hypothetical protein